MSSYRKALSAGVVIVLGGVAMADEPPVGGKTGKPEERGGRVSHGDEETLAAQQPKTDVLDGWPERSQELARAMIDKYGEPDERTDRRMIWNYNGPWIQTVVYRDEVQHDFPKPHGDLLEQTVALTVPADKVDDLVSFDGSLTVRRTDGLVSSRCDDEALNILALNLANHIVAGDTTAKNARKTFAKAVVAILKGKTPASSEQLDFDGTATGTADPDKPEKVRLSD